MAFSKFKNYSEERIADIYLKELYKIVKSNKENCFLNDLLERKRIYHDQEIIDGVIKLLIDKNFIAIEEYSLSMTGYKGTKGPLEIIYDPKSQVARYTLTSKGKEFISTKQILDIEGNIYRRSQIEKWIERIISFTLGVLATIMAT